MSIQSGFGSVLDHDHIISPDLELYLRSEFCCIIMFHTLSSLTVVIIYDVDPTQTHKRAYTYASNINIWATTKKVYVRDMYWNGIKLKTCKTKVTL